MSRIFNNVCKWVARARLRQCRQRAYTLIEIAIALVVIGLLLGGALVPLNERYKRQHINEAKELLNNAKTAVFLYAIRHKTAARKLTYYDGATYTINADRPYLPCPDTDNDGLEDRHALSSTLIVVSTTTLQSTLGLCEEEKGTIPWKTLGLKDADPWGNRLTYRVDPAFSDSLTGFDELTRADIFDRRKEITVTASGERMYSLRDNRDEAGNIICSSFTNDTSGGGCPTKKLDNILSGIVTSENLTLGARIFPKYNDPKIQAASGLIDGAAFVVLSHGSNGHGAINRHDKCHAPITGTATSGAYLAEEVNAYYRANHPFIMPIAGGKSFGCIAPSDYGGLLRESLFVSTPTAETAGFVNDDIVVWASSNELAAFLLRGGALPISKLDFLPQ